MVGDCKFCDSQFCIAHRMPESHACKGMAVRKEAISQSWLVARSDLASAAGYFTAGQLSPKDGFR